MDLDAGNPRPEYWSFYASDGAELRFADIGDEDAPPLILLHGFTGSSKVWKRNWSALSTVFRVITPDLRGHGPYANADLKRTPNSSGYHVSRLAMDLKTLIDSLGLAEGKIMCIAGSLGCAVLWSFAELFTPAAFSHVVWVDQSPLQNYEPDGSWGPDHGNRSCNSASALAQLRTTLKYQPDDAFKGTIASCLAYRSHPRPTDNITPATAAKDEDFFLNIAREGDPLWLGKLMADHTALDWRDSIRHTFGGSLGAETKVLVIACNRSGCFPPAGPLSVLDLINPQRAPVSRVRGITIDWGGHWCYYEQPEKFNDLVLRFLMNEDQG